MTTRYILEYRSEFGHIPRRIEFDNQDDAYALVESLSPEIPIHLSVVEEPAVADRAPVAEPVPVDTFPNGEPTERGRSMREPPAFPGCMVPPVAVARPLGTREEIRPLHEVYWADQGDADADKHLSFDSYCAGFRTALIVVAAPPAPAPVADAVAHRKCGTCGMLFFHCRCCGEDTPAGAKETK